MAAFGLEMTIMKNRAFTFMSSLWMALLIYLSLFRPSASVGELLFPHFDVFAHLFFYAVLFLLLLFTFHFEWRWQHSYSLAIVVAFSFGVLMEFCQGFFTDYRSPSLKDVISNGLGIGVSFLVIKFKKGVI